MSSDSVSPKNDRPQQSKRPRKKPGKGAGRGIALPSFLAKIPLPYLGGGVVAVGMILFMIIQAMMTPLPIQSQSPEPAVQQDVVEQSESQPQPQPIPSTVPAETGEQKVTVPITPTYSGPQGGVIAASGTQLPLITPYNSPPAELGRRVRMDLAAFESRTTLYETSDNGSGTALGYGVRLPSDWVKISDQEGGRGQGISDILGQFISPPVDGLRQYFMIEVEKVPFAMDIRSFMDVRSKTDLIVYQSISFYGKNRAEVLYVLTENNVSYVVRSVSIMSGDQVITASYRVPADQYEANEDMQTWVVTRFYALNVNNDPPEETKPADFLDLATFQYPVSWQLQKMDVQTMERMRISIANTSRDMSLDDKSVLKGQIDVVTFVRDSQNSEARMIDMMNGLVAGQGVHLGEPIGRFDVELFKGLDPVFARVYPLIDQNGVVHPYQYWLVQTKGPKRFFMVGLFTATRDQSYMEFAQNFGAFKTVLSSLQEGTGQE